MRAAQRKPVSGRVNERVIEAVHVRQISQNQSIAFTIPVLQPGMHAKKWKGLH